jgi:hypothetical protein
MLFDKDKRKDTTRRLFVPLVVFLIDSRHSLVTNSHVYRFLCSLHLSFMEITRDLSGGKPNIAKYLILFVVVVLLL